MLLRDSVPGTMGRGWCGWYSAACMHPLVASEMEISARKSTENANGNTPHSLVVFCWKRSSTREMQVQLTVDSLPKLCMMQSLEVIWISARSLASTVAAGHRLCS